MSIDSIKTQIVILNKKKTELENILQRNKIQHEMRTKDLQDDFGIKLDEIDSTIKILETEIDAETIALQADVTKFEEYIQKLTKVIND